MSDERIISRSISPTLYEEIRLQDDSHSTHKQETSVTDTDGEPIASTPTQLSGTVDEDKAIQLLLQRGLSPEQIIEFVRIHKESKDAGNHAALDIISGVRTDELPERIHTVGQYS